MSAAPKHKVAKVAAALYGVLEMDVSDRQMKKAREAIVMYNAGKTTKEIIKELGIVRVKSHK